MKHNIQLQTDLYNIMSFVDPTRATTAPQNMQSNASPFSEPSLKAYYQQVIRNTPGTRLFSLNAHKAIQIGYGNSKKAFYCPAAEGHVFFRSITEGIIPVHKMLPPSLPEPEDFQKRSAYGTFPYQTEMTVPQGSKIDMVVRDGIAYWLDYLQGKREGAYQIYWCAAPANVLGA